MKLGSRLRARLFAGVVVTVPAVVTILALRFLFQNVDALLGPAIARLIGRDIPGLGFVATVVLVFLAGSIATNVAGRRALGWIESIFTRLPFVRRIYNASKDIVDSATLSQRQVFRDVVLVEFPRVGLHSYGFVTSYTSRATAAGTVRLANVFIPGPPMPTTGVMVVAPVEDLVYLDIPVEAALKLILSAGLAGPAQLVERPAV